MSNKIFSKLNINEIVIYINIIVCIGYNFL